MTDPLDLRKSRLVDEQIRAAEDRAIPAMIGKAAYEAYAEEAKRYVIDLSPLPWSEVSPDAQCRWVKIAQAVVKEARRWEA